MTSKFVRASAALILLQLCASEVQAKPIMIVSVIYGTPQTGRICDATARIASLCSGKSQCAIDVGNNSLCQDPDFLSVKQANIEYRCGRTLRVIAVGEYNTANIACE